MGRGVARRLGASHPRIDTIEQPLSDLSGYGADTEALRHAVTRGPGHDVAYALAEGLLTQGRCAFAECVNSRRVTRGPWAAGARRTDAPFHEAELLLSDPAEHEHQATTRTMDIPGLTLDTAGKPPEHTIKDNSSPISSPSGA
ncbi:adenylyl-sulfate kinase [Streptomyces sp. 604F]|uniref:AAA family ATPase n=1 Tax=Streptomyces sp. 604F TaxID=1476754 RepID=UPI001EF24823|nr:adenylyl-sulfate kinase [Streptomyces sp. 604F]WDV30862.1 adenylyl-sulfate kinase [Streptomyces sp. AD16]